MPTKAPLPPKENALFKRILKCYEQKQYKNGLKFCKQILINPKFNEHGETLAMKGLTLNCMGRKDDAYDFVKRGLKNDLTSHVCWHVYGLLQRSDRKYDDAIKCYRNALKWDKENLQILRDLSLLQIQMRDLEGYRDTRYQLLVLRPVQRASWIGYAMAFHLLKDYDMAFTILEEFRKTCQPKPYDYEYSEMLLYQNMILSEAEKHKEALDHLAKYEKQILDRLAIQETRGKLYLAMGRLPDAENMFWELIERNGENHAYYSHLEAAMKPETPEARLKIYTKAKKLSPHSMCPRRIPMDFTSGEVFTRYADELLRASIRKGMQPLFTILRDLYKDSQKVLILEGLVLGYQANLNECQRFSQQDGDSPKEDPTTELYTWFYLAQHYDYLRQYAKAIYYIDKCLNHTNTFIEAQAIKGQIYKHAGDINEAVRQLDEAQSLDTADRYMNCWCARYMLQNNMLKEAEAMCSKFTREGVSAMENLNEMQCMWFQTQTALASQRMGKYGEALKKCHELDRHFTEIIEDQFDFHTYCMRKMTLRSYIELLRLEDVLRSHRFYFVSAKAAIEIYIRLHDHPLSDSDEIDDLDQENLSPAELKKLKNKQRKKAKKEALKKEREKQEDHKKEPKAKNAEADLDGPKEEELLPEKLARPEHPLEEAVRFLKPLQLLASNHMETHTMAFDIYFRKGKLLLMLQSIKRGHLLDPSHPRLHECLVKFLKLVQGTNLSELPDAMQLLLKQEMEPIYGCIDPGTLNKQLLEQHSKSARHLVSGAKMMYYLDPSLQDQAIFIVTHLSSDSLGSEHEVCEEVLQMLRGGVFGKCDEATIEAHVAQCHNLFPLHRAFMHPAQQLQLDSKIDDDQTDTCSLPNGDSSP